MVLGICTHEKAKSPAIILIKKFDLLGKNQWLERNMEDENIWADWKCLF
jgi:hypothetical protein